MPKLQSIIAVPNLDNFNSGISNPSKIFPSRPSVVPNAIYEKGIERSASAHPIPSNALPMMARIPKTKYLNEYMTVDTKSLVYQKIGIERPMSAMSSPAESPPSDGGGGGGGVGKTSLRLVKSQVRGVGEQSGCLEAVDGVRVSSRRSTSEYARVGKEDEGLSQEIGGKGRAKRIGKRKSVNFDDEEPAEKTRRRSSVASDIVKPQAKRYAGGLLMV
jgi:hypothetical protein